MTVVDQGTERVMDADAAFLLKMTQRALTDDQVAAQNIVASLDEISALWQEETPQRTIVYCVYADAGDVKYAIISLRIASLLDRERPTARLKLEPWVVQRALDRDPQLRLSVSEQQVVVAAIRSPGKVRWPRWWTVGANSGTSADPE